MIFDNTVKESLELGKTIVTAAYQVPGKETEIYSRTGIIEKYSDINIVLKHYEGHCKVALGKNDIRFYNSNIIGQTIIPINLINEITIIGTTDSISTK